MMNITTLTNVPKVPLMYWILLIMIAACYAYILISDTKIKFRFKKNSLHISDQFFLEQFDVIKKYYYVRIIHVKLFDWYKSEKCCITIHCRRKDKQDIIQMFYQLMGENVRSVEIS